MAEGQVREGNQRALDPAALDALRELTGDDSDVLQEIVVAFLEDAPLRLEEIGRGIDEGDAKLVRRAAHTLKSNALTFGALTLADACRRLEEAAKDEALALDGARPLAAEVDRELGPARLQIESLTA